MASPSIASATDRARITPQAVLRLLGIFGILLFLIVPHLCYRAARRPSPMVMAFLNAVGWVGGLRIRTTGKRLKRNVLFAANHVSWLDIMALGGAARSAFVAKSEVRDTPLVGWLSDQNHSVYVEREDKLNVADQINQLRDALADNWSVTVFPEATTTDGQSLLPFKTSMLKVLEPPPPGVLVQPVHLDYGPVAEEIGWVGVEAGQDNAIRLLTRPGSFRVVANFLEPFSPADFPGRKAISAEARVRIETALVAALGKPLRPFTWHSVPGATV